MLINEGFEFFASRRFEVGSGRSNRPYDSGDCCALVLVFSTSRGLTGTVRYIPPQFLIAVELRGQRQQVAGERIMPVIVLLIEHRDQRVGVLQIGLSYFDQTQCRDRDDENSQIGGKGDDVP